MIVRARVMAIWLLFVLLVMPLGLAAQDDQPVHPLLEMLAKVPYTAALPTEEDSFVDISYADYRALEQARPGVQSPESWAEFNGWTQTDDAAGMLWLANSGRIAGGWDGLGLAIKVGGDIPQVMGFDVFDIDRTLQSGRPPSMGLVFGGAFDADSIAAAFTARDYTSIEANGVTMWCGPVGCENGPNYDAKNRNNANLFGGRLGKQPPFALLPGYILQADDLNVLNAMMDTHQGKTDSLLDLNEYRAIAEAITESQGESLDLLVQARFLITQIMLLDMFGPDLTSIVADYGELPTYSLAAMVDRQEDEFQVAMLAVAYSTEEDATAAAAELTSRLASFPLDPETPDSPATTDDENIGATVDEPRVYYSEAAERWVAIAAVRYPFPEDIDAEHPAASGKVYQGWIRNFYMATFTPLMLLTEGGNQ